MKSIGSSKYSEVMPMLNRIAKLYGLKLNRARDFKVARMILANRYNNQ